LIIPEERKNAVALLGCISTAAAGDIQRNRRRRERHLDIARETTHI
jgi:hypothetical protein